MTEYFSAHYRLASYQPLEKAAAVLAGEQSSGTFTPVALETDALIARHGATVIGVETTDEPLAALPGSWNPAGAESLNVGIVEIGFPIENVGTSIEELYTTVAGNLFELRDLAAVKLLDVEIPPQILSAYRGPRVGMVGTRVIVNRLEGPLIGTIIKPSIGIKFDALAGLVTDLAEAGIDFIKDDEINGNALDLPFVERAETVLTTLDRVAQATGNRPMYALNITGDLDDMLRRAELVEKAGGSSIMVVLPAVGFAALEYIRRRTPLAIHTHRAGFQSISRTPELGVDYAVYQKFARLAGADQLHVGGIDSKFFESNESVVHSARALRTPLGDTRLPATVVSSGQSAATAQAAYDALETTDLLIMAGGGISGHPDGAKAGVESMRDAWQAIEDGVPVEAAARDSVALARALEKFGGRG
ncbi:RuBisCO large subunit C-terminal-like domain-containing protein [Compostimonas suwonensis]|uniref:Ribulose-bisphosphate carboxylase large chain n=1 Tax=Compostimonas suwonensis TaxID=1048394 RepID=A0A2M9BBQ2_9MICO|nr:RuBisCO large subunit C-terminal-like domain-containing protein [Compostimonas suwonensis]PJJ55373.1 ribulose-bisphosphate carboxylase large chain [Compostimonas suwonensis]